MHFSLALCFNEYKYIIFSFLFCIYFIYSSFQENVNDISITVPSSQTKQRSQLEITY
jgi:hypothetical protein